MHIQMQNILFYFFLQIFLPEQNFQPATKTKQNKIKGIKNCPITNTTSNNHLTFPLTLAHSLPSPHGMSTPNSLADDFIFWCFVVPLSLTAVAFGFCIVYRGWFGHTDQTVRSEDPGLQIRASSRQGSGHSVYSLEESHSQPSNKRMSSWDV